MRAAPPPEELTGKTNIYCAPHRPTLRVTQVTEETDSTKHLTARRADQPCASRKSQETSIHTAQGCAMRNVKLRNA
ncbi:hypothetical protein A2U01_0074299 [Trifolium medium]|uniref:Uncharacterized protein n=1 Tax=Trifolium medium TaxID=97028 RepID=A0A392SW67_9FABA|nr:hypothetical protein [Trifolium medium]